ncbi:MAG: GntR family transcriptional regulator [Planctomycetes bacterium]|nr:GntR family transcriptional regulator [Planctomycetota bacterium]
MFLKVQPTSPVPMYRQLMDQIRLAVASGRLKADEQLPSVREVAEELQINLQTAVRAYNELVREGVLEMRRGLGTYVPSRPRALPDAAARERVREHAREFCLAAFAYGLSIEEVVKMVNKIWHEEVRR